MNAQYEETHTKFQIYLDGIYFTIGTMSKLGYGDITGISIGEMLYAAFLVVILILLHRVTPSFLHVHWNGDDCLPRGELTLSVSEI